MLRIIAPPLFEGRPEVTIYDSIVNEFQTKIPIKVYQLGINNPVECGGVYTSKIMTKYYADITSMVINDIEHNDVLFWIDGWNPCLPLVWQYASAENINIFNVSIWHSSATTPGDYLYNSEWAKDFQSHLLKYTNKIFVATNYAKSSIIADDKSNIFVTGLPFDTSVLKPNITKDNSVIFGHRWADDKNPESFLKLSTVFKDIGMKFIILSPSDILENISETTNQITGYDIDLSDSNIELRVVSKSQYYEEIGKAKYVFADSELETFGYFVLESVLSGAIPILNDNECYLELYGKKYCYKNKHHKHVFSNSIEFSINNAAEMILNNYNTSLSSIQERLQAILDSSVNKMFEHIKEYL